MRERAIGIAWKVYLIYGIYMALIGILALAAPASLYIGQFVSFTGSSFAEFSAANTQVGHFIGFAFRAFGAMALLVGIFKIFIALFPYRRAEAWSWWLVLIIGILAYTFLFPYSFIIGDWTTFLFVIIAFILFLIALLVPARAMLSRRQSI